MRTAEGALALVALSLALPGTVAKAEASDAWWGRDKALHFGISAGLAAGFYGVGTTFLEEPWERALFGGGVALGLGIAKELWDLAGNGTASWRDFLWDVVGVAAGLALAVAIDLIVRATRGDDPPSGSARAGPWPLRAGPEGVGWRW